ncbi:E3 ubiquitin-protein ligase RNF128 isoform X1 [Protopterus annectens]|uniref:E3 ubiquitin-protein ligase RNF128 isoform X1 n=1 Tax=Protopterus annectens TaxID=7888 RepID=UPI001CF9D5EF|nr:E3 ubiquitin-protein ligase RNF128 isoform X1 [Protopterus annectens]
MEPRLPGLLLSVVASGSSWLIPSLLMLSAVPGLYSSQVWTAYVNISFPSSGNSTLWQREEDGVYGVQSYRDTRWGLLVLPSLKDRDRYQDEAIYGCSRKVTYQVPTYVKDWIALVKRGGECTFSQKIHQATDKGANAVVVFNSDMGDVVIPMSHPDTGNAVAIMIGNTKGLALVDLIQRGTPVSMIIEVGRLHGPTANYYSIFFVSIAFFIVTAATVGYFIFYSARRLRVMRALNRRQKQLKQDAKKAINQLQLRTLKQGDPALGPEGDSCAVCIEVYRPSDVVRILTCNHFFHKACIDPWLLEHRTCPMCKCDILKALGIEADVEEGPETPPEQETVIPSAPEGTAYTEPQDNRSETASSGYASVQGVEEATVDEDHSSPSQGDRMNLVNHDSVHVAVNVPHHDNPTFEAEESHIQEVKS